MNVSGVHPAIEYAMRAPALFKPQATAQAVAATVLRRSIDQNEAAGQEILQMLDSRAGRRLDVTV
jgi:hypothetical protein